MNSLQSTVLDRMKILPIAQQQEILNFVEFLQTKTAVQGKQLEMEGSSATDRPQILNQLNQVYAEESSDLDPMLKNMQFLSLSHEDWQAKKLGDRALRSRQMLQEIIIH